MNRLGLSPEVVTQRLRAASRLSPLGERPIVSAKAGSSPRSISSRLRLLSRLRNLCLRLGRCGGPPAVPADPSELSDALSHPEERVPQGH